MKNPNIAGANISTPQAEKSIIKNIIWKNLITDQRGIISIRLNTFVDSIGMIV